MNKLNDYSGEDMPQFTPTKGRESIIVQKPSIQDVVSNLTRLKNQGLPHIMSPKSKILGLPPIAKKDQIYFKMADEMEKTVWDDIDSHLHNAACCILFDRNGHTRQNIHYIREEIAKKFNALSDTNGASSSSKNHIFTDVLKVASVNLGLFLKKLRENPDVGYPVDSPTPEVVAWKEIEEAGAWLIELGNNMIQLSKEAFKNDLNEKEKTLAENLHFKYGEKFGKDIFAAWQSQITEYYGSSGAIMSIVDEDQSSDRIPDYISPSDIGYASMLGKGRNTLHRTLSDYENPHKAYKLVLVRIMAFVIQIRQSICQLQSHFSRLKRSNDIKNHSIIKKQAFRMACILSEMMFLHKILTIMLPPVD